MMHGQKNIKLQIELILQQCLGTTADWTTKAT